MERLNRPPTLTAATAQNIQQAILRGDFAPGDALREADLSENLGVSRGTVREALRLLHQEGALVEVIPHRGAFVIQLTVERAKEEAPVGFGAFATHSRPPQPPPPERAQLRAAAAKAATVHGPPEGGKSHDDP